MPLGGAGAIAEQRVVAIEALEDGLGDRPCVLGQRSLAGGEGGGGASSGDDYGGYSGGGQPDRSSGPKQDFPMDDGIPF